MTLEVIINIVFGGIAITFLSIAWYYFAKALTRDYR